MMPGSERAEASHSSGVTQSRIEAERLRALVESLGLGVLVEDETRRVSLVNQAFCGMFGIPVSADQLLGADCAVAARQAAELVQAPEQFLARIDELLARRAHATGDEVRFRDGRVLERDYIPIGVDHVARGHVWVYRDVTLERRHAELERATAVRDELRLAVDTLPGLVFSARPDGHVDFFNQRFCDYTGLSLEQARGWGWETAIFPADLPAVRTYWSSTLSSGKPGQTEARLRRFDGAYRWHLFHAVPLAGERGEPVKWYGQTTDIDDRKRAEALLAGEKRMLEMLARGCSLSSILEKLCLLVEETASGCRCGVLLVDSSGCRLEHGAAPSLPESYNDSIHGRPVNLWSGPCGMAAFSKEQVIASDTATDTRWDSYGWRELATAHGLKSCWSMPILSAERTALGTFAIYQDEPGSPTPLQQALIEQFTYLASVVLERKRSEDALQRARAELAHVTRVTTLGELAASIAHEVNQPLSAIVADAGACLNWLSHQHPDLGKIRASLADIVNEGARGGEILTRIRALLSRSAPAHGRCDLTSAIHGALELVRPELARQRVVLETELARDACEVQGDPVELQQVLLNLLLNAAEAAREFGPERRRVIVRSSFERKEDRTWVVVSVEDAGVGIPDTDHDRLFAAFYTTKPGGLGMGLSIIRSILDRHRGRIWANSNAEYGATFHFALPALS